MTIAPIQAYASRTGTRRNLDALRGAGWNLLVAALGVHRSEGFNYMLENSAYSYFTNGIPADWSDNGNAGKPFLSLLRKLGGKPEVTMVIAPDIVCGGEASLELSLSWLPRLRSAAPIVIIPVQPGITRHMLRGVVGPSVGIFVGGGTDWKEATCAAWSEFAHQHGAVCHVGRVNTQRRLSIVKAAGADSFDGSSVSRYAVTLADLQRAMVKPAQRDMEIQALDLEGVAGIEELARQLRREHAARTSHGRQVSERTKPQPDGDMQTLSLAGMETETRPAETKPGSER